MAAQAMPSPALGIVKQVLSGDTIVIRDRPVNGPPPERTIVLSNISCGRLARKPNPANQVPNIEDPFAWEAREFVRSKLIGKEVCYVMEKDLPSGRHYGTVFLGKSPDAENIALCLLSRGLAEVRKGMNPSVAEKNEVYQHYLNTEEIAKKAGMGKWSNIPETPRSVIWSIDDSKAFLDRLKGVRIHGIIEYVRDGSTMQITLLPDKSDVQLDAYYVIWLTLSGIRTPSMRTEEGTQVSEPFGLDAQFFVESRLLQREVVVLLESCQNQNFFGSVLHPNGNIAELLLREGLAKCIDWSLSVVSVPGATDSYKSAERLAKTKKLRLWQSFQVVNTPNGLTATRSNKLVPGVTLSGHILEVGNGDNVTVKCSDGYARKFFLSSIRGPKPTPASKSNDIGPTSRSRVRPLYDIPYAFEARERLRSFIGKPVSVHVDYIQPKTPTIPDERVCCTVTCGTENLAESLVAEGLATVILYKNSDDSRSSAYLSLKAAEEQAIAKGLGLHNKGDPPIHRISDLTNNLPKARQFFAFFKRTPRMDAIVEFVPHASRMRLYLPGETCLITLLLGGIQCPRKRPTKPDSTEDEDVPFASEAATFVKELCTHRNVEISIDNMDRAGNFIGWAFLDTNPNEPTSSTPVKSAGKKKKKNIEVPVAKPKVNINLLLVSKGFAVVHRAASTEASPYYQDLLKAEAAAKSQKLGLWSLDDFMQSWLSHMDDPSYIANETHEDSVQLFPGGISTSYLDDISALNLNERKDDNSVDDEPKLQWIAAQVSAITKPVAGTEGLRFFAQHVSDSAAIVQISHTLNSPAPTLSPNYRPKKGEIFAACFSSDDCWYRARMVKQDSRSITVQYIDFGNEEVISSADISNRAAPLVSSPLTSMPPKAREYRLAFVQLPPDDSDRSCAERLFANTVMNKEILLAIRFDAIPCANETAKPVPAVSVKVPSTPIAGTSASLSWLDISYHLIEEGLVCIEPMRPNMIKQVPRSLLSEYLEAQNRAKKERKNVWRYGDFRVDGTA